MSMYFAGLYCCCVGYSILWLLIGRRCRTVIQVPLEKQVMYCSILCVLLWLNMSSYWIFCA